jgi:hypothetical protein
VVIDILEGTPDLMLVIETPNRELLAEFTVRVLSRIETVTEIICHARGAQFMIPSTGLITDIGGQDSKAIEVDPEGNVTNFAMNDKCAAGTGRFLLHQETSFTLCIKHQRKTSRLLSFINHKPRREMIINTLR